MNKGKNRFLAVSSAPLPLRALRGLEPCRPSICTLRYHGNGEAITARIKLDLWGVGEHN